MVCHWIFIPSARIATVTPLPEGGKVERGGDHLFEFDRHHRVEEGTRDWNRVCLPHCEIPRAVRGFVRKEQLLEVYGVNNELYVRIAPYIESGGNVQQVRVNQLEFKELLRHPYLSYKQVQAIVNLRNRKGRVDSIRELGMLDEFTSDDIYRLEPYLEF